MEEVKFETKKDWMGKLLLGGPTLIISVLVLFRLIGITLGETIPELKILIISSLFFWIFSALAWNFTFYTIDQKSFTARYAYFKKREVKLTDIKEIKKQEFGQWIYGLSKDVLVLKLTNGQELCISPLKPNKLINEINKRRKTIANNVYI